MRGTRTRQVITTIGVAWALSATAAIGVMLWSAPRCTGTLPTDACPIGARR